MTCLENRTYEVPYHRIAHCSVDTFPAFFIMVEKTASDKIVEKVRSESRSPTSLKRETYRYFQAELDELDPRGVHEAVLCGRQSEFIDVEGRERFTCAISTGSLLLNACRRGRRQEATGKEILVGINLVWCKPVEGLSLIVVWAFKYQQPCKIIGYGLCSHVDYDACEFVLQALEKEAESVADRFQMHALPLMDVVPFLF